MAVPKAIVGGIYYLSGVLVKAETKEVAKKLIAKGFRTATEGIKNSGLKVQTVTNSNFATYVTRALAKAIKKAKDLRAPPKLDKFGRPIARGQGNNKLGSSGQSEIGRRLGLRRMANFDKPLAKPPASTGGKPPQVTTKPAAKPKADNNKVVAVKPQATRARADKTSGASAGSKIVSATPTIAGLIAAGAIGKVAYDAYIKENNPTASQIKAADKKIKTIAQGDVYAQRLLEKTKQIDATVLRAKKKTKADALKEKIKAKVKAEAAELDAAKAAALKEKIAAKAREAEIKKRKAAKLDAAEADAIRKNTPERKSIINKAVRFAAVGEGAGLVKIRKDADKKALTEVLNKKIASKNSTAAKEKARAIDGEYKSLASAKKAGSLYYMHKGKELRAAITAEETESASKRIRAEAMKKIREGK